MIRVNCAFDIDFRLDFFLSFKYRLLCECYLISSFRCFVFHIVFLFLGDRDLIKKLILQDVDLNVTDKNGQTPIFAACRKGVVAFIHLSILKIFKILCFLLEFERTCWHCRVAVQKRCRHKSSRHLWQFANFHCYSKR